MGKMTNDNGRSIRHAVEGFRVFLETKDGRPHSSIRYPPKLIYYFLKTYRNKVSFEDRFIKSRSNQDLNIELTIPCIELEKVDLVECPCAPASGCYFFKSVEKIPKMLNGIPNAVSLVHQNDNQKNYGAFTYVDWYNFKDKINSRLKAQAKAPYFTMKNINSKRHLYVYANTGGITNLKAVTISAIFNDPLEVASFPICGEEAKLVCSPLDEEFIIEDEIQGKVFELTYNALMGFSNASLAPDNLNNNNNETVGNPLS